MADLTFINVYENPEGELDSSSIFFSFEEAKEDVDRSAKSEYKYRFTIEVEHDFFGKGHHCTDSFDIRKVRL
jgi:hypothetical protein